MASMFCSRLLRLLYNVCFLGQKFKTPRWGWQFLVLLPNCLRPIFAFWWKKCVIYDDSKFECYVVFIEYYREIYILLDRCVNILWWSLCDYFVNVYYVSGTKFHSGGDVTVRVWLLYCLVSLSFILLWFGFLNLFLLFGCSFISSFLFIRLGSFMSCVFVIIIIQIVTREVQKFVTKGEKCSSSILSRLQYRFTFEVRWIIMFVFRVVKDVYLVKKVFWVSKMYLWLCWKVSLVGVFLVLLFSHTRNYILSFGIFFLYFPFVFVSAVSGFYFLSWNILAIVTE